MLLPRRRITSLSILTILALSLWYLLDSLSTHTESVSLSNPSTLKTRPKDAKLVSDLPTQTDAVRDQTLPTDVSPTVLIDPQPPPDTVENAPQIEAAQRAQAAMQQGSQKNRWDTGQHTFGSRKFVAKYPVQFVQEMSKSLPIELPKLQYQFEKEAAEAKDTRLERLAAVKESFRHSWEGYKKHAWMMDEVKPASGGFHQSFGGWAATLVDTLDTLWIIGLKDDFEEAVNAAKSIDFAETESDQVNVFETTIRYLGGFLGAYDISDGEYPVLLEKATQVGELLYCAFDTPNHMPVTRWPWKAALEGADQTASPHTLIAEIGSLTLEFTRLSQLTGDPKYYDAITRIMAEFQRAQGNTSIPGLWPTVVNAKRMTFDGTGFTLGGMADSLYEYLPKQHMLLGGRTESVDYKSMYKYAITAAMNHVFFQPMVPDGSDILISGSAYVTGQDNRIILEPHGQHLGCYTGGMIGIGAKLFNQPEHIYMARKLVDGCIWAYKQMPTGIMPEYFEMVPCEMNSDCHWDQTRWETAIRATYEKHKELNANVEMTSEEMAAKTPDQMLKELRLKLGFTEISDRRYILRPEAIESVFIHYRLTGDRDLLDSAWHMFQSIENATRTDIANAAIHDVMSNGVPEKHNSMESFWLAETLKYFYLIFSEPGVVDLDKYIL